MRSSREGLPLSSYFSDDEILELQRLPEDGAGINEDEDTPFSLPISELPPLLGALYTHDYPTMKVLLEQGEDPELKNERGMTLLMCAANLNEADIVRLLLEHGAQPKTATEDGDTALHFAAREECEESIRILLEDERAARCLTLPNTEGMTPPMLALAHGRTGNLNIFFARLSDDEAQVELDRRTVDDCTMLHMAVQSGKPALLDWLLEKGQRPVLVDRIGNSPLHNAARNGSTRMVHALIRAGADINLANNNGLTPLHMAALSRHSHIISTLLTAGAIPDRPDSDGLTPLHIAAAKFDMSSAKILLSRKADPNAATRHGITPLFMAINAGFRDGVKLLLKEGADSTCYVYGNISAQEFAKYSGFNNIANLIKKDNVSKGFRPKITGMTAEEITEAIRRCHQER